MVIIWNRNKFKIDDCRISYTSMTVDTCDRECLEYFTSLIDKTNFLKKNENRLILYKDGVVFNIVNPYVIRTGDNHVYFDIKDSYGIKDEQTITDIKLLLLE